MASRASNERRCVGNKAPCEGKQFCVRVCVWGVCGGGLGHDSITYNRVANLNAK